MTKNGGETPANHLTRSVLGAALQDTFCILLNLPKRFGTFAQR